MKKPWVVFLVFAGVFACGAIVGGAIAFRRGAYLLQQKGADRFVFQQWRELSDKLELTPEQKKKSRPIIGRAMKDRQAEQKQMQVIMERMMADLAALLTPEQRAKYEEHREEQRARDRQWVEWTRKLRDRRGGVPPLGPDGKPLPPSFFQEHRERDFHRPPGPRPEKREEKSPERAPAPEPVESAPAEAGSET
jgi:Spy/CpxP family protein refolding chaperone